MFETTNQIILSSCYVLGMSTTTIRTFTMNLMTNGAGTTFFPSAKLVGTASIAAVDAETTHFGGKVTVYKRYRVKYSTHRAVGHVRTLPPAPPEKAKKRIHYTSWPKYA